MHIHVSPPSNMLRSATEDQGACPLIFGTSAKLGKIPPALSEKVRRAPTFKGGKDHQWRHAED